MEEPSRREERRRPARRRGIGVRAPHPGHLSLVAAIGLLATAAVMLAIGVSAQAELSQYQGAPSCTTAPAAPRTCRITLPAKVANVYLRSGTQYVPGRNGRYVSPTAYRVSLDYGGRLPTIAVQPDGLSCDTLLTKGTAVTAEQWGTEVEALDVSGTRCPTIDDPSTIAGPRVVGGVLLGIAGLVLATVWWRNRHRFRRPTPVRAVAVRE